VIEFNRGGDWDDGGAIDNRYNYLSFGVLYFIEGKAMISYFFVGSDIFNDKKVLQ